MYASQNKLLKLDLSCVPIDTTTPVPRNRTRLVAKCDQQAAAMFHLIVDNHLELFHLVLNHYVN